MTGQMSRSEALERISQPELDDRFYEGEFEYVANKLDLSVDELREIFAGPNKTFRDYRNKHRLIGVGAQVMQKLGMERRLFW